MTYEEIRQQAAEAITELLGIAKLKKGDIFVIGCSSSEIKGEHIGKGSDIDAAKAVYDGVYPILKEKGVYLAAQCCEHLNRAIIVERAALLPGTEICNVVPQLHAGGSFAMHMVELECKITGTWNQGHNRNYGREVLEIEVGKNEDYRCIYDKDTHEYYLRIEA